jgi:hypothetical protein
MDTRRIVSWLVALLLCAVASFAVIFIAINRLKDGVCATQTDSICHPLMDIGMAVYEDATCHTTASANATFNALLFLQTGSEDPRSSDVYNDTGCRAHPRRVDVLCFAIGDVMACISHQEVGHATTIFKDGLVALSSHVWQFLSSYLLCLLALYQCSCCCCCCSSRGRKVKKD